jgi:hypothetical protein
MTRLSCFLGALIVVLASLTGVGFAQTQPNNDRVEALAQAIAKAEGFGVKGTIPTRYHNPGDIRTRKGIHYPGQVGINKHGYVIFKNDAAGFAALKNLLLKMALGQSRFYDTDMTILKVAKVYATGWRTWSKNVSKNLGVPANTTLKSYFFAPMDPPTIDFSLNPNVLSNLMAMNSIMIPSFAE